MSSDLAAQSATFESDATDDRTGKEGKIMIVPDLPEGYEDMTDEELDEALAPQGIDHEEFRAYLALMKIPPEELSARGLYII